MKTADKRTVLAGAILAAALAVVIAATNPFASSRPPIAPPLGDPDMLTAPTPTSSAAEHSAAGAPEREADVPPAGRLLAIEVIRRDNGRPVPGAEVWVLDDQESAAVFSNATCSLSSPVDAERFAREQGRRCAADAAGRALVPLPAASAAIAVRVGEWFGAAFWSPGSAAVVRVALDRDCAIRVLVLDGDDRAQAGVVVSLCDRNKQGEVRRATTAADGIALFAHAQLAARDDPLPWQAQRYAVGLCFAGHDSDDVAVDFASPPERPVVLRLLTSGWLRVAVRVGAPGAIGSVVAFVQPLPLQPDRAPFFANVQGSEAMRFRVALGRRYRLTAGVGDGYVIGPVDVAGPMAAGEEVAAALQIEAFMPVLVGAARDASGAPLRSARLQAHVAGDPAPGVFLGTTDDGGRFTIPLSPFCDGQPAAGVCLDLLRREGNTDVPSGEIGRAELQATLANRVYDLGAVEFAAAPLVASGRVVDDAGSGVHGCRFEVRSANAAAAPPVPAAGLIVRTDAAGAFTVRSREPLTGALTLRVANEACLPHADVPFGAGQQDLRIVLQLAGNVLLRCHTIAVVPRGALRATLRRQGEEQGSTRLAESQGTEPWFLWQSLAPGSWQASVSLFGHGQPLAVLDALAVGAGRCQDPRLGRVDLDLQVVTVTVTGRDARPVPQEAAAVAVVQLEGDDPAAFAIVDGVAKLVVARVPFDLEVRAPACAVAHLRAVAADLSVQLQPELAVRAHVDGLPELLPPGLAVALRLTRTEPGPRAGIACLLTDGTIGSLPAGDQGTSWCEIDAVMHTVELHVADSGDYRVAARLVGSQGLAAELLLRDPVLHLRGEPQQRVELQLAAEAFARAQRSLGGR